MLTLMRPLAALIIAASVALVVAAAPEARAVTPGRAATLPSPDEAKAAIDSARSAVETAAAGSEARAEALHRLADALATGALVVGPTAEGTAFRKEAAEAARSLREEHPGYARSAEVALIEGEVLLGLGQKSEALARWTGITASHPGTRQAQDAWVRIGDTWFDQAGLEQAKAAYDAAAKAETGNRLWAWAVYRRAWTHVNLGDFPGAVADFELLLGHTGTDPYIAKVREEAEKDWIFAYSAVSDPAEAPKRVAARFPGKERPMLMRLADAYDQQGRSQHAIKQWRALVDGAAPPERIALTVKIAGASLATGDRRGTLEGLREIATAVRGARPDKTITQQALAGPDEAAEKLTREVCRTWVAEHQKTKSADVLDQAIEACGLYLELWSHAPMAPDVRLSRGSALLDAGRTTEAIAELEAVVANHPVSASRDAARMLLDRARSR